MKITELYEDGVIVPGVNTTPDVKPGETERQAKKFFGGNGKPKPLGVKGATPNQAFNLGMTEGYKLQLERDKEMLVLNITDTATGKRTEVRGKSGYETNYDANDKLHQLLDKVGKSANISDLMNGEVVGINPKHPDGKSAKSATTKAFNLGLAENMSVTGTERRRLEKKKGIKIGTPEWFKHWFDLPYLREDITRDELMARLKDQQRGRYIKAMLDAMHKLVQSKGAKHSLGSYAFEVGKVFGFDSRELEKMYRDMYMSEVNEAFDNPYPFELIGPNDSQEFSALAQTPNGMLRMDFEATDYDNFGIDFSVGKSMGKTDSGDEFRVFATVVAMMTKWIKTVGIEHVESFDFGANKDEHASDGRAKLYTRFAKKLASQLGWKLEQSTTANGGTAFFKLTNPNPTPREQEYWDALDEDVTQSQLNALEKVVDKVFGQVGIDVEFTRHFLDRANDARNGEPISIKELAMLFKKEYQRWGKPIAQMGPNAQAVLKDLESDINVPFVLQWDREGNELDMIAKTVMRKKDFRTSNKEFPVEALTNNVMQRAYDTLSGIAKKHNRRSLESKVEEVFDVALSRTNENFADGKKKGKSRPGRVKRSGASCDGSVTELRKKAKNSSGEKAKMYHWCANMKSGRKKSK